VNARLQLRQPSPVDSGTAERGSYHMPEMFDWIFFAIILMPSAYLIWDWFKNK
jgi:hypothetical protein